MNVATVLLYHSSSVPTIHPFGRIFHPYRYAYTGFHLFPEQRQLEQYFSRMDGMDMDMKYELWLVAIASHSLPGILLIAARYIYIYMLGIQNVSDVMSDGVQQRIPIR